MSFDAILELTWVPIIGFAMSLMYGVLLLATGNPQILVGKKNTRPIKDSTKYAKEGGKLLLFLALGSLIMCVLLFVNVTVAFMQIIAWICAFAVMWKKVHNNYGPL